MTEIIFLVEDDPEGGYTDQAIGEAIFTQGETKEKLQAMIRDAARCHVDFDESLPPEILAGFTGSEYSE
jgi:hypothetical protein